MNMNSQHIYDEASESSFCNIVALQISIVFVSEVCSRICAHASSLLW